MKSAIFDFDGTLVNSESLHFKTFNKLFSKFGIEIALKDWHLYTGTGSRNILSKVFKANGIKEDVEKFVGVRNRYFHEELKKGNLKLIKGVNQFFRMLKKRGVECIIASSGQYSNVKMELKAVGLDGERFICSKEVKKLKPDPEIFLLAAKKLGRDPFECVVFEDAKAGVEAAKRAGMYCVAVGTDKKELSGADLVIKDFSELRTSDVEEIFKV